MNDLAPVMEVSSGQAPNPDSSAPDTSVAEPAKLEATPLSTRQRFSRLLRETHRELIIYAASLTGDHHAGQDIVQDAFVAAYRKFAEFDPDGDFGAWMRGFVRNKTRDWFRKQQRIPLPNSEIAEIEVDIAAWQSARAQGKGSVFEALETCLEALPERLSEAVRTFYLRDQSGEQAAETLGISPASLRKRLERAREQLHSCISRKTQPQPSPNNE